MVWLPTESVDVLKLACPAPFNAMGPARTVRPSLNVTVPSVTTDPVSVAVNVTGWPDVEGFALDVTAVVVFALFTVCASEEDPLGLKSPSPSYEAMIECDPTARLAPLNVA